MLKKWFLLFVSYTVMVSANAVTVTPVEEISTSKKSFQMGNSYKFRDINSEELYTASVVYYRPNGMLGQEAQIEIANFIDSSGKFIPGRITIIPDNHENFQEFMNYFQLSVFVFVRGSEICLKPDLHKFEIGNTFERNHKLVINIAPKHEISTCFDELEYNDVLEFRVVNDVYKNGKLYIKSGADIFGVIDSINDNGWCADNASLYLKKFITYTTSNEKVTLNTDLTIDGFELLKYKAGRLKQFFNYLSTYIRGKEIDIKMSDTDVNFVLIAE